MIFIHDIYQSEAGIYHIYQSDERIHAGIDQSEAGSPELGAEGEPQDADQTSRHRREPRGRTESDYRQFQLEPQIFVTISPSSKI